jgi:hypothetical protein
VDVDHRPLYRKSGPLRGDSLIALENRKDFTRNRPE